VNPEALHVLFFFAGDRHLFEVAFEYALPDRANTVVASWTVCFLLIAIGLSTCMILLLIHIDAFSVNEHPIGLFIKLVYQIFDVFHAKTSLRHARLSYEDTLTSDLNVASFRDSEGSLVVAHGRHS
jgi:hypothetical protein